MKLTRIPRGDLAKLDTPIYSGGARCALLLPGNRVLVGLRYSSVIVGLDPRTRTQTETAIHAAIYIGDERVVISNPRGLGIYDVAANAMAAEWGPSEAGAIALSADRTTLVSATWHDGDRAGELAIWDFASRALRLAMPVTARITWLAISADSRQLAAGDDAGAIRVWDLATARVQWTHAEPAHHHAGAFGPDGRLATTRDDMVIVRDGAGRAIQSWKAHRTGANVALCWVGGSLATMAASDAVKLWAPATGKRLASAKALRSPRDAPAISALGAMLVTSAPVALYAISEAR